LARTGERKNGVMPHLARGGRGEGGKGGGGADPVLCLPNSEKRGEKKERGVYAFSPPLLSKGGKKKRGIPLLWRGEEPTVPKPGRKKKAGIPSIAPRGGGAPTYPKKGKRKKKRRRSCAFFLKPMKEEGKTKSPSFLSYILLKHWMIKKKRCGPMFRTEGCFHPPESAQTKR